MIQQLKYLSYFFVEGSKHVLKIRPRVHYNNQRYLDFDHANACISEALKNAEPFLACRFGSGEMRTFLRAQEIKMGIRRRMPETNMDSMCINAGFFPRDEKLVLQFGDLMETVCREVDLIGIWETLPMENYVLNTYVKQAKCCYLSGLEPFFAKIPWTLALEGKRVLVIHPFVDTIREQYKKRETLFGAAEILPEFQLLTLKAVQTIAGQHDERFKDWFEALDYMYENALKETFDVAVIGCGAYGFPLAAMLKRAGKQAIHLGGATQLLFGIRGNRWDQKQEYQPFINENWCRPSLSERPDSADKIEGGCYW